MPWYLQTTRNWNYGQPVRQTRPEQNRTGQDKTRQDKTTHNFPPSTGSSHKNRPPLMSWHVVVLHTTWDQDINIVIPSQRNPAYIHEGLILAFSPPPSLHGWHPPDSTLKLASTFRAAAAAAFSQELSAALSLNRYWLLASFLLLVSWSSTVPLSRVDYIFKRETLQKKKKFTIL